MAELKIRSNSRQIPSSIEYTADKSYYDLLYGYLQEKSERKDEIRYVKKSDVNFSHIAELFGISRQSISKYFKRLIEKGLVIEDLPHKRYILAIMPNEDATLVPYKTLCLLNNTLSHRAISVYVYLLKRYWAEGQKEYIVTMKNLKNYLGLSVNTQSNDYIITNILFVLEKIGLVITELRQIDEQTTYRYVLAVRNWLWDIAK